MLETAMDSSKHMVSRVFLCLRLVSLGLLVSVVFAGTAAAAGTEAPPAPNPLEQGEEPQGNTSPPGGEEAPAPSGEGETPPPTGETAPTPPVEQPQTEPPPTPPAEQPAEKTPVPENTGETGLELQTKERQESGVGAGLPPEETTKISVLAPVVTVDAPTQATSEPTEGQVGLAGPSTTVPPSVGGTVQEAVTSAELGEASIVESAHRSAAQQAGRLSCELSALSGPLTQNCAAGWLGTPTLGSGSSTSANTEQALAAPPSSGGPGASSSAPAGGNRPAAPAQGGSTSNGAAGGAAGGSGAGGSGGGGLGLSAFLTIAGLLLLAAPHAMRRLRLSCLPWRTAFFVLIPERPG
jgi:cytoskeletal protein RodZ